MVFLLRSRRPPGPTRTDTLLPYSTRFRSHPGEGRDGGDGVAELATGVTLCALTLPPVPLVDEHRLAGQGERVEVARAELHHVHQPVTALRAVGRSEEHTSELQSLMRISYDVFCWKKKKNASRTTKPD